MTYIVGIQGYPDFRCSFVDPEIAIPHKASINIFGRDVKMLGINLNTTMIVSIQVAENG